MNVRFVLTSVLLLASSLCVTPLCVSTAVAAGTISGTVRNQTTGRASSGDDVILFRVAPGMQEEARTKTDAEGAFVLNVASPSAQHVLRVVHQGVNYDQTVSGTAPLKLSVFDVVPHIQGVNASLGIVQMESYGSVLKVTEMYAVTNASSPPVTQSRPGSFEIFVPERGALLSAEVKGPGSDWVKVSPVQAKHARNEYAVDWPLRPGDTLFKFSYHVPFESAATFRLKLAYPVQSFAVMHPPAMSFKASRAGTFKSPGIANGLQIEEAIAKPLVGEVPAFEIASGVATVPPPTSADKNALRSADSSRAAVAARNSNSTLAAGSAVYSRRLTTKWIMLCGLVLLFAVGVLAVYRTKRNPVPATAAGQAQLLESLKHELLKLDGDRLRGSISTEEYAAIRQALHQGIQRAVTRGKYS